MHGLLNVNKKLKLAGCILQRKSFYALRCCVLLFCVATLVGCAGRAKSVLSYVPPTSKTEVPLKVLLPCDSKQARLAVTRYFATAFSVQPEPGATHSELVFNIVIPEAELQSTLDCGIISVQNVPTDGKANIFQASTPKTGFLLADGTSVPKPAQVKTTASVNTTISLTSAEKGKTLLEVRAVYTTDFSLSRWVIISGFSLMMPERVSARFLDTAQLVFDSEDIGMLPTTFPERRACAGCIRGDWPIQCIATGMLEKNIINGVMRQISPKARP